MSNFSKKTRIYIAGHKGLVGSAVTRYLKAEGYENLILKTHADCDLEDGAAVERLFKEIRPEVVILAAAKVGGILANQDYPYDFIEKNLKIELNVIGQAHSYNVEQLVFLGSSCIYPKLAPQPLKESDLLTGPLEPTNRPYALAKIAGIELCWGLNRQYGRNYFAVMPTNLYGPEDNFDLETSHVLPALVRKFSEAVKNKQGSVVLWGSGKPYREFLHSDDLARAIVHLLGLQSREKSILFPPDAPPLINVGYGSDISILDLAKMIAETVGFKGEVHLDPSKPDGTPRKLMDSSKMFSLGWKPSISLSEGVREACKQFSAQYKGI